MLAQLIEDIIVVDDDPIQHFVFKKLIFKIDSKISLKSFYNGEEALFFLKKKVLGNSENRISLIFLDLNMPKMDGFGFLEEYRMLHQDLKSKNRVVILTSSIRNNDRILVLDFRELNGYYAKPISLDFLKKVINGLIANSVQEL
ncbi:response regulator [Algoriphagus lacus]|uniref:Response regulator n=1 Tax=Algoriphagus lacus TaxID=2056311 RepID=A0A418PLX1_9BACT|nr:response regulator [Algoriphagus lacus]RIW12185.1 response regulator [Algoriphagus lacus]